MPTPVRIGLIGAGKNTRERHIPGFRALVQARADVQPHSPQFFGRTHGLAGEGGCTEGSKPKGTNSEAEIQILGVCNRRPESTAEVAREYQIPRTYPHWQELVADPEIDAVVIGTWPYLHCPITLAALAAGKHVLTEARMAMNAAEAYRMRDAAKQRPDLAAQIVPSPFGMTADHVVRELIESDYLGELREYHVYSLTGALADPDAPLSWRQDEVLSGLNMLTLGILHETVSRWLPQPSRVVAQTNAFISQRAASPGGVHRPVGTPDSVQALTQLSTGARGVYQFSGVTPFGQGSGVCLYGSQGTLHYDFTNDRLYGTQKNGPLEFIPVAPEKAGGWRVEADFIESIREKKPVRLTDFDTGVAYMEFTEAVAQSALSGVPVDLPLK
ncbi:MAG: Gfo/Idh/MocA family protein [Gemmataceae bacterium]